MTPLRTFCMFAVILCAAACTAQAPVPPDKPKEAEKVHTSWSKEGRIPLFLDFGYEWRSHGQDVAWNSGFLHVRPRLDDLIDEDWVFHSFGFLARFERAYLISANPQRWFVGASYTFGADHSWGQDSEPLGSCFDIAFPLSRSSVITLSGTTVFGYMHSEATQEASKTSGIATQDALRLEHWDQLGIYFLRIEWGGALNLNLHDTPFLEWEAFIRFVIGRPYLPFGIAVGYRYLGTERGGGDLFTLGLDVAF